MTSPHDALGQSFDPIATLYDAVRPGYPLAVADLALARRRLAGFPHLSYLEGGFEVWPCRMPGSTC